MKWLKIFLWFAVLVAAFFYDRTWMFWVEAHRVDWLDTLMIFITDLGLFLGVLFFFTALFEKKLMHLFLLLMLAFLFALEASFLMKMVFEVPRPFVTWDLSPLQWEDDYSFPSMHAAFIFAALPFFKKGRLKKYYWFWMLFAALVAFSRVYVGVHYVSDVLAGALLGYFIGWVLFYFEENFALTAWLNHHIKDQFEVRRQIAHAFLGIIIIVLYGMDLVSAGVLLAILVAGAFFSVLSMFVDVPVVKSFLDYFERPHNRKTFPGKGAFFLVFGSLLSVILFREDIAMASIAIMALGDSVTNIFGRYFGEVKLFYNPKKTLDGVLVGIFVAILGAFYFVPLPAAIIASFTAMFVESMDLKIFVELDDNVLVPLVAGGVMTLIM